METATSNATTEQVLNHDNADDDNDDDDNDDDDNDDDDNDDDDDRQKVSIPVVCSGVCVRRVEAVLRIYRFHH